MATDQPLSFAVLLASLSLAGLACDEEPAKSPTRQDPGAEASSTSRDQTSVTHHNATGSKSGVPAEPLQQRPVEFKTPSEPGPHPFLLLLHGLGGDGESMLSLAAGSSFRGIVAAPDGLMDSAGRRFWNATEACCDLEASNPNDVAYLQAVIAEAISKHQADPERIFAVGYSNGGFMAHRLACEPNSKVSAIVSIAGAAPTPFRCSSPKRVLQIHGTEDEAVPYAGGVGRVVGTQPGALASVKSWAELSGCSESSTTQRDLLASIEGQETTVLAFSECTSGPVQLWTLQGVGHRIAGLLALRPHLLAFLHDG